MIGGKDKTRIRNATTPEFRDVLLSIARQAKGCARANRPLDTEALAPIETKVPMFGKTKGELLRLADQLGMDLS